MYCKKTMRISKKIARKIGNIKKSGICPSILNMSWHHVSAEFVANDILSAINIFLMLFPIALSLSFFCGISPLNGLLSSAIASCVSLVLGGSRYQISMLSLPLCLVTSEILIKYGYYGMFSVALFVALIVIAFGLFRFSDIFKYISVAYLSAVTVCVTTSIIIVHLQVILDINTANSSMNFLENFSIFFNNISSMNFKGMLEAAIFLSPLIFLKWKMKSNFSYLLYILLGMSIVFITGLFVRGNFFNIIGSGNNFIHDNIFSIPSLISNISFSQQFLMNMLNYAFVIALVLSSETCVSSNITSCFIGRRLQINAELISTGLSNLLSVAGGGGFISPNVRLTMNNVFYKNRTVVTLLFLSFFCFLAFKHGSTIMQYIPMKCFSCILIVFSVSAILNRNISAYWKRINNDTYIFCITLLVYAFFGFISAIIIGFSISMVFFARRMVKMNDSTIHSTKNHDSLMYEFLDNKYGKSKSLKISENVLAKIEVIHVRNALFLNLAKLAEEQLGKSGNYPRALIIYFSNISFLDKDATESLKLIVRNSKSYKCMVFVSGSNGTLIDILEQREKAENSGNIFGYIVPSFQECFSKIIGKI